ncbi:MAG: type II toxin-antitoxin system HicA family toxin [Moorea sp. SIO3I7]|uniref:type II toxin-antitoxin system HicA family toxin n=1 Tax=unclassified Moorena TaxID=2683338 RepID=UPI0013BC6839|nr:MULTISPECIES: type II toxin-antitoxin system HicA family toxin [unclassified Moorena]NEO01039.1 type II toxin-antitoxin system HicA family toxin [Moorena sp. SIO3I7]NEO63759.1 type II toxin-antitoxin system HicA family toxin [Moorena sp. SIO4G2]NEO17209.1 type II toxin-antitoxin system HicA family toxin [Moorena sp. SIO3E8]NEO24683.1 type II toxin-antitoxin system HicA family toxin [Moorena sp. SIO4A5]NEO40224.1 type II toxin-antitoxin system HicA family toxin [Moorena sp. SIOASIH]
MSQLPSLTGREIIAALEKAGFTVARVRGSHHILIHDDGRRTVIPVHSGETIGRGLLSQILRDTQLSREEFRELL